MKKKINITLSMKTFSKSKYQARGQTIIINNSLINTTEEVRYKNKDN